MMAAFHLGDPIPEGSGVVDLKGHVVEWSPLLTLLVTPVLFLLWYGDCGCGSVVEEVSRYHKVTGSIPLVCVLKCPWARYKKESANCPKCKLYTYLWCNWKWFQCVLVPLLEFDAYFHDYWNNIKNLRCFVRDNADLSFPRPVWIELRLIRLEWRLFWFLTGDTKENSKQFAPAVTERCKYAKLPGAAKERPP